MRLTEILKNECFAEAKIVAANGYIDQHVFSVMILEAIDIEKWGSKHQLILTSYYALKDLNDHELHVFFTKMDAIEISGLILKMDRLVKEVPKTLIELCDTFKIPLILIPQSTKYETIILAVLQPIINENSNILNSYYTARKTVNQLSLKELSFSELLKSFKQLLKVDCQFQNQSQTVFHTTKPSREIYTLISETMCPKLKFVDNQYTQKRIKYQDGTQDDLISVDIPDILDQKYSFSVFKSFDDLSENEIMMIENVTELLLTELLKLYAIKKNQSMRKNNQMHDLLLARYYSTEERDSILNILDLDKYPNYQGIMISLYGDNNTSLKNPIRSPLDPAIDYIKTHISDIAYFQKNYDVVFLHNFDQRKNKIDKDILLPILDIYKNIDANIVCHIGISSIQKANLESINDNLLNLKKFMKIVHKDSVALEYDHMGFFKLFYNIESIDELLDYVTPEILTLVEDNPEFAKTLSTFLSLNQNYVKTGEKLFIHPKTVRYRIDKLVAQLNIDLHDTNTLLSLQVALKICEYTKLLT